MKVKSYDEGRESCICCASEDAGAEHRGDIAAVDEEIVACNRGCSIRHGANPRTTRSGVHICLGYSDQMLMLIRPD